MDAHDTARLTTIASRMRIDAASADVVAQLESAGLGVVLLKGPSLARWLYPGSESRTYIDCDLLVRPADLAGAERAMEQLGYRRHFDDRQMPEWWREHAGDWLREDGLTVDLHRRLPGMRADPVAVWDALSADSERMELGGGSAPVLSLTARALHVALHAAHHGPGHPQPMRDLERALELVDEATWRAASILAERVQASSAFAAGLRLHPQGVELADRLGLPEVDSVATALRASTTPPVALGFEQLASASGLTARVRILWAKVIPPPAFIRHWDPRAAEGRRALIRAYLRRPVWLLQQAPRGWTAFRAAQRRVDGQGPPDE